MTYPPDRLARWQPTTETELRTAAAEGRLEETHYCDLKALIKPGPKNNKELARDLVQFALDGGRLIVGVWEPEVEGEPLVFEPVPLDGLPERIESIARDIPDPPMQVACSVIRSDDDGSTGYVVVDVPVSGVAPHMVDGVYFGRGDKRKHRLSDAEVLRHHASRAAAAGRIDSVLDDLVTRDPVPGDEQEQAHLFLAAEPLAGRPEMALTLVGAEWVGHVFPLVQTAAALRLAGGPSGNQFSPDLGQATQSSRRADGVALTNYGLEPGRIPGRHGRDGSIDEDFIEVEITDGGGVRIGMGRFSDLLHSDDPPSQTLLDVAAPVLTRRLLHIVDGVGQASGYNGPWAIGVVATKMQGLTPHSLRMRGMSQASPYDRDVYRQTITVSSLDVARTPGAVTARLLGRLLRALNVTHLHEGMLVDPNPDQAPGAPQ